MSDTSARQSKAHLLALIWRNYEINVAPFRFVVRSHLRRAFWFYWPIIDVFYLFTLRSLQAWNTHFCSFAMGRWLLVEPTARANVILRIQVALFGVVVFWFRVPKVQLHFSHEKVILHQEYLTCGWDILALVGNDKYPLGEEPSCFGPRKKNHKAHCQATGNLFCNIAGGPWSKSKKVLWSTNGNFTNH